MYRSYEGEIELPRVMRPVVCSTFLFDLGSHNTASIASLHLEGLLF